MATKKNFYSNTKDLVPLMFDQFFGMEKKF